MADKRIEPRLMCADLVEIEWRDKNGQTQQTVANLGARGRNCPKNAENEVEKLQTR